MKNTPGRFLQYRPATVLGVTGDDAFSFLQGQFTNELRQPAGRVVYGLWLNQKGKVLADSYVLRRAENNFTVISTSSPSNVIRQRLDQYIIADDVSLSDETATAHGLALWGDEAAEHLQAVLGEAPAVGHFSHREGLVVFHGRRAGGENFEIIGPEQRIAEVRLALQGREVEAATADEADVTRITSGQPAIPADIGPSDLPNEGGLETTAISYTKGCYLGQEVMARLLNLGQVRRNLRIIQGEGAAPASGALLYQGGNRIGEVRSVVPSGTRFVGFAMINRLGLAENHGFGLVADGPESIRSSTDV